MAQHTFAELIAVYNFLSRAKIGRFSSYATGARRVDKLLKERGMTMGQALAAMRTPAPVEFADDASYAEALAACGQDDATNENAAPAPAEQMDAIVEAANADPIPDAPAEPAPAPDIADAILAGAGVGGYPKKAGSQARYFKATNGTLTVFRSTMTRPYNSAWIKGTRSFGFSEKAGECPAIEITADEYTALVAIKARRLGGKMTGPADSWVLNSDLSPAAPPAPPAPPARAAAPAAPIIAAAVRATLPPPPNFEAATHKPYRAKLAKLIELAHAGDIGGMLAIEIKPSSTSPKALIRYRNAVIAALQGTTHIPTPPTPPAARAPKPGRAAKAEPAPAAAKYTQLADRDRKLIKGATSFSVFRSGGRGKTEKQFFESLAAAMAAAKADDRSVVYAVTRHGQSILVPADYIDARA